MFYHCLNGIFNTSKYRNSHFYAIILVKNSLNLILSCEMPPFISFVYDLWPPEIKLSLKKYEKAREKVDDILRMDTQFLIYMYCWLIVMGGEGRNQHTDLYLGLNVWVEMEEEEEKGVRLCIYELKLSWERETSRNEKEEQKVSWPLHFIKNWILLPPKQSRGLFVPWNHYFR